MTSNDFKNPNTCQDPNLQQEEKREEKEKISDPMHSTMAIFLGEEHTAIFLDASILTVHFPTENKLGSFFPYKFAFSPIIDNNKIHPPGVLVGLIRFKRTPNG